MNNRAKLEEKKTRVNFLNMLDSLWYYRFNQYLFIECLKKINKTNSLKVRFTISELNLNCDNLTLSNSLCEFNDISIFLDDKCEEIGNLLDDYDFDEDNGVIIFNFSDSVIKANLYSETDCNDYFKVMNSSISDVYFMTYWIRKYLINKADFSVNYNSLWAEKFIGDNRNVRDLKSYIVKRSINHLNSLDLSIKFEQNYELINNEISKVKIKINTKIDSILEQEKIIDLLHHYLDYKTKTTELMDKFDEEYDIPNFRINKYSQLVLQNIYISDYRFKYKIVIEYRLHNRYKDEITMTTLKNDGLWLSSLEQIDKKNIDKYANTNKIYYLPESILLKAQKSNNRGYLAKYGETSLFFINGIYIYR